MGFWNLSRHTHTSTQIPHTILKECRWNTRKKKQKKTRTTKMREKVLHSPKSNLQQFTISNKSNRCVSMESHTQKESWWLMCVCVYLKWDRSVKCIRNGSGKHTENIVCDNHFIHISSEWNHFVSVNSSVKTISNNNNNKKIIYWKIINKR